jgi:hypothetical protein
MSNALHFPFSPDAGLAAARQALRRTPPAVLQGAMAVALLCTLGSGSINAMPSAHVEAALPVAAASTVETPVAVERSRCPGCGQVASIRHVEATELLPAAYEFTVRMRDGSVRTSSDASAGKWLVGDRIILVGGPARADGTTN